MAETVQIRRADPGPVAPPAPEPLPWAPPRMSNTALHPVAAPKVWRVMPAELDDLLSWLLPRLKEPWVDLADDRSVHWLRAAMSDRQSLFICTSMVCGLFYATNTAREPSPLVMEDFVRSRAPNNEEAVLLYKYAEDWAAGLGARRFIVNVDSDAAMLHVQPALSNLQKGYEVKKKTLYSVGIKPRKG